MENGIELEARRRVKEYRRRRMLGLGVALLTLIYIVYVLHLVLDDRMAWVFGHMAALCLFMGGFVTYIVLLIICRLILGSASEKLTSIMTAECDPFLYEACLMQLRPVFFRYQMKCNIGMAQYYQGNFEQAWATFKDIPGFKMKGIFKINYYMILSSLYFIRESGMEVSELEAAYQRSMKNQRERKYFQLLCANNNLFRALENEDYTAAFHFLRERMELAGKVVHLWHHVIFSYYEAQIFKGMKEKESERLALKYVSEKGGRLYYAQEARKQLKEML